MFDGIDESKIEEVLRDFRRAEAEKEEDKRERRSKDETWKVLAKYFVHGIAFAVLFTILAILWVFGLIFLVMIGSIIGLIIGFGLLILVIGFVNSLITTWLWFSVKSGFWSIMGHGFVLLIALVTVNIAFFFVPSLVFPGIATTVVTFIIGSFVDGFVGKKVAEWWKEEHHQDVSEAIEAEWQDRNL